jgi:anti-sigma-K factor RskA
MNTENPSRFPEPTDCETLRALLPAYSVGATDADETRLVESLLPRCPEVAAELDEYNGLAEAMLYTVAPVAPPARVHDRLMQRVAERSVTKQPRYAAYRGWAALAAASLVLLVFSNLYWIAQINTLSTARTAAEARLSEQENAIAELLAQESQQVALVATQQNVYARVVWTPESEYFLLTTNRLPALAPDQTYQLWLIGEGGPVSAGIFEVDAAGRKAMLFPMPQSLANYQALGISVEPAGGSEQPTTTPLAVGEIS